MNKALKKLMSASLSATMAIAGMTFPASAADIDGWTVRINGGCKANAEVDTKVSKSGNASMKVVNDSPVTSNVYGQIVTKVPMTAGKKYNISAQVKSEKCVNLAFLAEGWTKRYNLTKLGTKFDWRNFEFIYTATKTSEQSEFSILVEGVAEVWFDDIKIIDMDTGENLVSNSSFDGSADASDSAVTDVADGTLEELYNTIKKSDKFTEEAIESVRGAFKYMPVYNAESISIDGKIDDWENYPAISMPTLPTQYQVYIDDGRSKDVEAKAKFAQDDEAFYFVIEVTDDIYHYEAGESNYWKGDSIQLALSNIDEGYGNELGLAYNPDTERGEIYGSGFSAEYKAMMTIGASKEGNKTVYEVKIPWNVKFSEKPEQLLFNFLVNDNDGDGRRYCAELAPGISEGKTNAVFPILEILSGQKDWYAWVEGSRSCYTEDEIIYDYYIVNSGEERVFTVESEIDGSKADIIVPANSGIRGELMKVYNDDGTAYPSAVFTVDDDSYKSQFKVNVVKKLPTEEYSWGLVKKLEKNAKELKELIEKCEKKDIYPEYERIDYMVINRFAEYVTQDIEHDEFTRIHYTEETTDALYEKAKKSLNAYLNGEKSPLAVPRYITSDATPKGQMIYATTEYNGEYEERPVFFVGYGHFDDARDDIPVFNDFAVNTIQNEIGPSSVLENGSAWKFGNSGEGIASADTNETAEGNQSLKLTYKSALQPNKYMTVFQTVNVEPGKTYVLSGKVKAVNAKTCWISANDYGDRNQMAGTYDWKDFSAEYTAPAGKTSTVIRILVEDVTEAIYFDDLSFKEKDKSDELLSDGGFELYASTAAYEMNYESAGLLKMMKTLEMAEEHNIAVSLLLSPHYFIDQVITTFNIAYSDNAFLKYNVNAPQARSIIETYLRGVVPIFTQYKSVNNIVISNEPHFHSYYLPDFYTPLWQDWLKLRYNGDISAVNREFREDYNDFSEITLSFSESEFAKYYDYKLFNEDMFGGWHKFMADIIHELAPDMPINSKITGYTSSIDRGYSTFTDGTGYEAYYEYLDYNGCDFWNCIDDKLEPLVKEMWYDYMLSFKNAPIINSEDHVVTDKSKIYTLEVADYVAQDIYMGAIHGRAMSDMWVWERVHDPKSNLGDSVINRPDMISKIGYATHDLNRLAYEIEALQLEPAEVGIIYSNADMMFNDASMHAAYEAYEGTIFNGQKARFVLDIMPEAIHDYKMIIAPNVKYVTEATLLNLREYIENGGKVLVFGTDSFRYNEHDFEHDRQLVEYILNNSEVIDYQGLPGGIQNMTKEEFCSYVREALKDAGAYYVRVLDTKTGKPAHNIEYNIGVYEGKVIINLANFGEEKTVKIIAGDKNVEKAVELRSFENVENEFTVGKYQVITLETDIDSQFPDTYGHWAEDEINALADSGIINGVSDSRYSPDSKTTRWQFHALLSRASGITVPEYDSESPEFRPNDDITRAEMCEMLVKFYEASKGTLNVAEISFADNELISDKELVGKAVSSGLMEGRDDGKFDPYGSATRAEAAAVISRFIG